MIRFAIVLVLLLPQMAAADPTGLFELIEARLALMDEVAAYKWRRELPIENLEREQVVLDSATIDAVNNGLRPEGSRLFFEAQIDAAKEIQQYWFDRFERGEAVPAAADLDEVVRPRLLALGRGIIESIAATGPVSPLWHDEFMRLVDVPGLSRQTRSALFRSLSQVEAFANRLEKILATGELRVGTTGDYEPFSSLTNTGYRGIDIDLARDLADALGVKLVTVQTSWPTLMHDLEEDRFDIAMSGVSRNTERQKRGYFSAPYYSGGKTAIVRCADVERFGSLAAIDQPEVRVVVNPGGTNQQFVQNNITRAQVIVHDDNRTIFHQIIGNAADVMITDAIEVRLKSAQHEPLCPATPGETFSYLEKGYLMQPDIRLKEYIDTWLELRIADGTVEEVFRRHLQPANLTDL